MTRTNCTVSVQTRLQTYFQHKKALATHLQQTNGSKVSIELYHYCHMQIICRHVHVLVLPCKSNLDKRTS